MYYKLDGSFGKSFERFCGILMWCVNFTIIDLWFPVFINGGCFS